MSPSAGAVVRHRSASLCRRGDGGEIKNDGNRATPQDHLGLVGSHQRINAALALEMLRQSGLLAPRKAEQHSLTLRSCHIESNLSLGMVTPKSIERGLANVYWPGRMQFVKDLNLILDGAHNLDGIKTLRNALSDLFPNRTFQFIFGCYENKDGIKMLQELVHEGDSVILTEPNAKRATFPKEELAQAALKLRLDFHVEASIKEALTRSQSNKNEGANCITVVTGSLSLLRDTMHALGWQSVEDGIIDENVAIG
jgi:folylpolyglutamate synthase/dihydropteroate synthase